MWDWNLRARLIRVDEKGPSRKESSKSKIKSRMKNLKFMEHLLNNHQHTPKNLNLTPSFFHQLYISRCRIKTAKSRGSNNRPVFSSFFLFFFSVFERRGEKKCLSAMKKKSFSRFFFFFFFISSVLQPILVLFFSQTWDSHDELLNRLTSSFYLNFFFFF